MSDEATQRLLGYVTSEGLLNHSYAIELESGALFATVQSSATIGRAQWTIKFRPTTAALDRRVVIAIVAQRIMETLEQDLCTKVCWFALPIGVFALAATALVAAVYSCGGHQAGQDASAGVFAIGVALIWPLICVTEGISGCVAAMCRSYEKHGCVLLCYPCVALSYLSTARRSTELHEYR